MKIKMLARAIAALLALSPPAQPTLAVQQVGSAFATPGAVLNFQVVLSNGAAANLSTIQGMFVPSGISNVQLGPAAIAAGKVKACNSFNVVCLVYGIGISATGMSLPQLAIPDGVILTFSYQVPTNPFLSPGSDVIIDFWSPVFASDLNGLNLSIPVTGVTVKYAPPAPAAGGNPQIVNNKPQPVPVAMTGSPVTIYSTPGVTLGPGQCINIFWAATASANASGNASLTNTIMELRVDGNVIHTAYKIGNPATGGGMGQSLSTDYCNDDGVTSSQWYLDRTPLYYGGGSGALGDGHTAPVPDGMGGIPSPVDFSIPHTVSLTATAPNGNVSGAGWRITQ